MKKTLITTYEMMGSMDSWSSFVSLSRNERTLVWTMYIAPDGDRQSVTSAEHNNEEELLLFIEVLQDNWMSPDSFIDDLRTSADPRLIELAGTLDRINKKQ